jgi:hypothetical protein
MTDAKNRGLSSMKQIGRRYEGASLNISFQSKSPTIHFSGRRMGETASFSSGTEGRRLV